MTAVKEFIAELKLFTKFLIGVIVAFALLMQVDAVEAYVTPIVANHPKISAFIAGVAGLGLLLQNPVVRKIAHLDDLDEGADRGENDKP